VTPATPAATMFLLLSNSMVYIGFLTVYTLYVVISLLLRADRRVHCAVKLCLCKVCTFVVKQACLIKTQENKTGDVLSCYVQQGSIHHTLLYIHSRTYASIYKSRQFENYSQKVNVLPTSSSRRRHVQLCVSEDTGDMHIASHTVVPGTGSTSYPGLAERAVVG